MFSVARPSRQLALFVVLFVSISRWSNAQAQRFATGEVTDPMGAAVTHAQVSLVDMSSKIALHTTTNDAGVYLLPAVPAGTYTLMVEAPGFANYQQAGLVVSTAQNLEIAVKLSLTSANQSISVNADGQSLEQMPAVGKTGTMLEDLPQSVQVIGRAIVDEQGGIALKDTIRNSSGVGQGGSDSFGFGDRFLIRGLEARVYNDGFSDGDGRNGIPHSLNGVERVEVLEGPGSSLFGSGPPGGTINLVHYAPFGSRQFGASFQTGSFGLYSGSAFARGDIAGGLHYRVDGLAQHEDGFRALSGADYELRPELGWTMGHHVSTFSVDGRALEATPDPAGLIYVNGTPITGVSREAKYYTPFGLADQTLLRSTFNDIWTAKPFLTVTNRFSYMHRNLSILRNGDGGTVTGTVFSGRQLRKQHDVLNDYDYEAEPVFHFRTGRIGHTLLTGFEFQHQDLNTSRSTADLPNITNIFAPVVPETSRAGLVFLQDAKHSGLVDTLTANYSGVYAADQIDLTSKWKLRLTGREDIWATNLTPHVFIPGRILSGATLIEPPDSYGRRDNPFSWSVGTVYRILPGVSPFFGVSESHLAPFSSESTQNGVHDPESGISYEGGVKIAAFDKRLAFTAAGFDVIRNNVFTLIGDVPNFSNQKSYGGEANVQVQLATGWNLMANTTLENAKLTSNPSAPAFVGNLPVGTPQHIVNFWTSYDLSRVKLHGLKVGGGLTYRDKMFGDTGNTKSVPSYVTLDTVVSYIGEKLDASFGFRNLTNTTYFTGANGGGGFVGEPFSVFGQVRRSFGGSR